MLITYCKLYEIMYLSLTHLIVFWSEVLLLFLLTLEWYIFAKTFSFSLSKMAKWLCFMGLFYGIFFSVTQSENLILLIGNFSLFMFIGMTDTFGLGFCTFFNMKSIFGFFTMWSLCFSFVHEVILIEYFYFCFSDYVRNLTLYKSFNFLFL